MSSRPMTYQELCDICSEVECEVGGIKWSIHRWPVAEGFMLQLRYREADVVTGEVGDQYGRKWYVSRFSTKSEVVQTILKAALTSAEHMVREHFRFKGASVFSPHFDVEYLVNLALTKSFESRP